MTLSQPLDLAGDEFLRWVLCVALWTTLIPMLGLATAWMLRRRSAASRVFVHRVAVASLLAAPLLAWWTPELGLSIWPRPDVKTVSGPLAPSPSPAVVAVKRSQPTEASIPVTETLVSPSLPSPVEVAAPSPDVEFPLAATLAVAWLAASLVLFSQMVVSGVTASVRWRGASDQLPPQLTSLVAQAASQIGLRDPRVRLCKTITIPVSCGALFRRVLLPADAVKWPPQKTRLVLLHEFGHAARRDVLWAILSGAARSLFWPSPLVWWLDGQLRRDTEIACDDAVLESGVDGCAYAELLLSFARDAVRRPQPAYLAMADRQDIAGRIRGILQTDAPRGRGSRALAIAFLALVISATLGSTALLPAVSAEAPDDTDNKAPTSEAKQDDPRKEKTYLLRGHVLEKGARSPVVGAKITVLVASEVAVEKRVLTAVTDEQGAYEVQVPLGHVQIWFPQMPPGYWLESDQNTAVIVTSPKKPVASHEILASRGASWRVRLQMSEGALPGGCQINGYQLVDNKHYQTSVDLSDKGKGRFTLPPIEGKFALGAWHRDSLIAPSKFEVQRDAAFNPDRVKQVKRVDGGFELEDATGKHAKVTGVEVSLNKDQVLLTLTASPGKETPVVKVTGRILDDRGNPLAGARVGVAVSSGGGGSDTGKSAHSRDDGRFTVAVPLAGPVQNAKFNLVVTRKGYASIDSASKPIGGARLLDFADVVLKKGASIPIRVVDERGEPIAGAVIEPVNNFASRRQVTRSDARGRAEVRDLAAGRHRLLVLYGDLNTTSYAFLPSGKTAAETIIKLRPRKTPTAPPANRKPPIAVGAQAPELTIAQWTDGKSRKLSDHRGKVVVLDFWGIWCSPCVNAIPSMKEIAKKYRDRGVVFLGVHTAGTEMESIRALKKGKQWNVVSGLDRGDDIQTGKTTGDYGVIGYPTIVIVDPDGKVAYNSGIQPKDRAKFMEKTNKLAAANKIPWPPKPDAPREELIELMNRLQVAMLSEQIDAVLAK